MVRQTLRWSILCLSLTLMACAQNGGKGSGSGGNTNSCVAGTVFVAQYNKWFPQGSCPSGQGFVAQANQCFAGTLCNNNQPPLSNGHSWTGSINITSPETYRQIVEDWGICNVGLFGHWFDNDCKTWDDRAALSFDVAPGQMPVPGVVSVVAYGSSSGRTLWLPYNGQVSVINNNTGFELRSTGSGYGYNKVFSAVGSTLLVNAGVLVQQVHLTLSYGGTQFGTSDVILRW